MSNQNNTKDTIIYDYVGKQIYPITNISSILTDGYSSDITLDSYPIYKYITSCIDEHNKKLNYVDLSTNQIVHGEKTFNDFIRFNSEVSGKITQAISDENGQNISEKFNDLDQKINTNDENIVNINKSIETIDSSIKYILENEKDLDLSNYTGAIKFNVSTSGTAAEIIGDMNITEKLTANTIDATAINSINGFFETSDERVKTFKNPITVNLDKLSKLKKSHFIYNNNPTLEHIGVSAQEIKELYPEIVIEGEYGILRVDYSKLSVIALAAIDELYKENIELKNRLNIIESKM